MLNDELLPQSIDSTLKERSIEPASQPKIEIKSFDEGADLEYTMAVEVIPEFEITDLSALEVERLKAEVDEDKVTEALERLAADQKNYEKIEEDRPAAEGDQALIDFLGKLDGEPFEGGAGEDVPLVLGSGQFIPGFEEQLIGKSVGYEGDISVTFPAEYGAEHMAGKEAVFEVKLKEIRTAAEAKIDDTLATNLGLENLEALQQIMRDRIAEEYGQVARTRLKRTVLDLLALIMGSGGAIYLTTVSGRADAPIHLTGLLIGFQMVVISLYAFAVSNFLWRRFEFSSRAYWLEIDGNYQQSQVDYGRTLDDTIKTERGRISAVWHRPVGQHCESGRLSF